jgi:hypothetical protein
MATDVILRNYITKLAYTTLGNTLKDLNINYLIDIKTILLSNPELNTLIDSFILKYTPDALLNNTFRTENNYVTNTMLEYNKHDTIYRIVVKGSFCYYLLQKRFLELGTPIPELNSLSSNDLDTYIATNTLLSPADSRMLISLLSRLILDISQSLSIKYLAQIDITSILNAINSDSSENFREIVVNFCGESGEFKLDENGIKVVKIDRPDFELIRVMIGLVVNSRKIEVELLDFSFMLQNQIFWFQSCLSISNVIRISSIEFLIHDLTYLLQLGDNVSLMKKETREKNLALLKLVYCSYHILEKYNVYGKFNKLYIKELCVEYYTPFFIKYNITEDNQKITLLPYIIGKLDANIALNSFINETLIMNLSSSYKYLYDDNLQTGYNLVSLSVDNLRILLGVTQKLVRNVSNERNLVLILYELIKLYENNENSILTLHCYINTILKINSKINYYIFKKIINEIYNSYIFNIHTTFNIKDLINKFNENLITIKTKTPISINYSKPYNINIRTVYNNAYIVSSIYDIIVRLELKSYFNVLDTDYYKIVIVIDSNLLDNNVMIPIIVINISPDFKMPTRFIKRINNNYLI